MRQRFAKVLENRNKILLKPCFVKHFHNFLGRLVLFEYPILVMQNHVRQVDYCCQLELAVYTFSFPLVYIVRTSCKYTKFNK